VARLPCEEVMHGSRQYSAPRISNRVEAGLALAGAFAGPHDLAQATDHAGGPAIVPVDGVFGGWSFGLWGSNTRSWR